MSTGQKIWIGLFTVSPLLVLFFMFVMLFREIPELERAHHQVGDGPPEAFYSLMAGFFGGFVLFFLLMLGGIVYYCVHALKNPALSTEAQIVWVIVFIFTGLLANFIYYFLYIFHESEAPAVKPEPFGA
ncbi:MAG: hypothetical protein AAGN35_19535 [Bacteroidota bacterium]